MVLGSKLDQERLTVASNRMYSQLIAAQPWIRFAQTAIKARLGSHDANKSVIIGSDYSGQQKTSQYLTYSFVVACEPTWAWDQARRSFRQHHIPDNRRLSFKRFGKTNNPVALAHFLDITRLLEGDLFVFAFEKSLIKSLPLIQPTKKDFGLEARWKPQALEEATRKALLLSLIAGRYVPEYGSMTWITDEDPSIGNELMFTDVQRMAATLTGVLSPLYRGMFKMGTTGQDCQHMFREDFVAIADFAAGMIAELASHLTDQPEITPMAHPCKYASFSELSQKTQVISDWFWFSKSSFKKNCFLIEGTKERFRLVELLISL